MANPTSFKQHGATLILTVDGTTYSKTIKLKDERDQVVELAKEVIAKPNKTNTAKLVKIFTANTEKVKKEEEQKKVVAKSVEKQIKKVSKSKKEAVNEVIKEVEKVVSKEENLEEKIQRLERENKDLRDKLINKPAPVVSPVRRPGEH